ncbi:MAG: hypothetical protein JWP95_1090 [Actinotalea sp.]|nr:hypothetical protein [Actinotalea sp.]
MSDSFSPTPGSDPSEAVPNPETGVGIGAGEPSTFEPEEDTASSPEQAPPPGH